jgi:hypothetical protein
MPLHHEFNRDVRLTDESKGDVHEWLEPSDDPVDHSVVLASVPPPMAYTAS